MVAVHPEDDHLEVEVGHRHGELDRPHGVRREIHRYENVFDSHTDLLGGPGAMYYRGGRQIPRRIRGRSSSPTNPTSLHQSMFASVNHDRKADSGIFSALAGRNFKMDEKQDKPVGASPTVKVGLGLGVALGAVAVG